MNSSTHWMIMSRLGLLLCAVLVFQGCHSPESSARHQLDQLLGKNDPKLQQAPTAQEPSDPMLRQMEQTLEHQHTLAQKLENLGSGISTAFQIPSIDFKETEKAYELRVPVSRPEDAENVQLQVEPFHIQVAGQFTTHPGGNSHFSASSSFMKSFPTTQELLPTQITRTLQGKTLLITIPKKTPGSAPISPSTPKHSPNSLPQPKILPRDIQRQLSHPQSYI